MIIVFVPFIIKLFLFYHSYCLKIKGQYLQILSHKKNQKCPFTLKEYLESDDKESCLAPEIDHKNKNSSNALEPINFLLEKAGLKEKESDYEFKH